jgi:hypothetical protein
LEKSFSHNIFANYTSSRKNSTYKMADANPDIVDATSRATIHAQIQSAIGLNIPVFLRIKPKTISAEHWV